MLLLLERSISHFQNLHIECHVNDDLHHQIIQDNNNNNIFQYHEISL